VATVALAHHTSHVASPAMIARSAETTVTLWVQLDMLRARL
jgi:hypothetical protein